VNKRGKYPREFKLEAVRLLNDGGSPASQIAMQLGIKRTLLYRWRDQLSSHGAEAFKGPGRPSVSCMSEVSRLRHELQAVQEERDILKKAAAYFARDLK